MKKLWFLLMLVLVAGLVLGPEGRLAAQEGLTCQQLARIKSCHCLEVFIKEYPDSIVVVYGDFLTDEELQPYLDAYETYCSAPIEPTEESPVIPAISTPIPFTPTPAPGCDQWMPTGPLVSFTRDVNLYWEPRADAVTPFIVRSGQTAKLVSADGYYIKIVWVCDLYWVPAWGVARD